MGAQQPVFVSNEADAKTAAAVKRGFLALEDSEWDKAKQYFDQALALDAECAEAYLGLALVNEQCKDEQHYIDRACARKGSSETLFLPAESKRVDEIVKANTIKDYLDESTLREMLLFDLRYPSAVKGQTQVAQQEKERFKNNRSLSLAFRFAKGETAEKLRAFQSRLFEGLDQQVEKAKAQEEQERKGQKEFAAWKAAQEEKGDSNAK